MDFLILFLASYGLCFGLMNGKARFLTDALKRVPFRVQGSGEDQTTFFERMLLCPYCTGFHTGWLSWLLVRGHGSWAQLGYDVVGNVISLTTEIVATAFASSAICYLLDTFAQWAEDTAGAAKS